MKKVDGKKSAKLKAAALAPRQAPIIEPQIVRFDGPPQLRPAMPRNAAEAGHLPEPLGEDVLAVAIAYAGRCMEHGGNVVDLKDAAQLDAYINELMGRLASMAEAGDDRAAWFLGGKVSRYAKRFLELCRQNPERLQPLVSGWTELPILATRWFFNEDEPHESQRQAKRLLQSLGVLPKTKRARSVESEIARELHQWLVPIIQAKRFIGDWLLSAVAEPVRSCALAAEPHHPLTRQNYRAWWTASQPLLSMLDRFQNQPWSCDFTRAPYFERHWNNAVVKTLDAEHRRAKVLDMISKAVCQGFRSIAPAG